MNTPILARLCRFLRQTGGNATVEFVLLLPLFVMVLMLTTDATTLYNRQASFQNVSRDTARIVSRYGMTAAEGITYATGRATSNGVTPTVTVEVVNGMVTVTISANSNDIAPYGIISFAAGDTIEAVATNTMEPV